MTITNVFQLLGLSYAVIGIAILANSKYYRKMLDEYIHSLPVIFFNAFLVLAIGFLLLQVHSAWDLELPILVTILGWLAIIKGVFILVFPQAYLKVVKAVKLHYLRFEAVLAVLIGLAFLYMSYMV